MDIHTYNGVIRWHGSTWRRANGSGQAFAGGNTVINFTTSNAVGTNISEGTIEVARPSTIYVVTGQGSQALVRHGHLQHLASCSTNAHPFTVSGFPIIKIVESDPKGSPSTCSGIKRQHKCQRYMGMTYDAMGMDGNAKTLPYSPVSTFEPQSTLHPNGLLFAT
jgi:hypothetical protein